MTPADERRLLTLYRDPAIRVKTIAFIFNMGKSQISRIANRHGLRRKVPHNRKSRVVADIVLWRNEQIIADYRAGMLIREIAANFHLSTQMIHRIASNAGLRRNKRKSHANTTPRGGNNQSNPQPLREGCEVSPIP